MGNNKKDEKREKSCDKPDSVKFLLETDKTTKDKTRNPVKPV